MGEIDLATLERLGKERRFSARTLEIAKRLLVYGEPVSLLAAEFGLHPQRVYGVKRQVLAALEASTLPDDWVEVTLAGPRALIEDLRRRHEEGMARLKARSHDKA